MKDLTVKEVQGRYGHDVIDELKEPGEYKLKFNEPKAPFDFHKWFEEREADDFDGYCRVVNVLRVALVRYGRMQMILIDEPNNDGDNPSWWYYNGYEQQFKPMPREEVNAELEGAVY